MKKYIIILSLLLFVGCNKSSSSPTASDTTETKSCTELTATYAATSQASGADPTSRELCDDNIAALVALVDAECEGFTSVEYDESTMASMSIMCDFLTGG